MLNPPPDRTIEPGRAADRDRRGRRRAGRGGAVRRRPSTRRRSPRAARRARARAHRSPGLEQRARRPSSASSTSYVAPGSRVSSSWPTAPSVAPRRGDRRGARATSRSTCRQGDTTDRATLDALEPQRFDHVIVLCYSDALDAQRADARTLVTLLHLRDIADRRDARVHDRQRDARRPQPPAGRGDPGRRRDRQRQDHQPDAGPDLREPRPRRRCSPSSSQPRARRSTCGRPATTLSPASRPTSPPWSRPRGGAASARSATGSRPRPTTPSRDFGVRDQPAEVGALGARGRSGHRPRRALAGRPRPARIQPGYGVRYRVGKIFCIRHSARGEPWGRIRRRSIIRRGS